GGSSGDENKGERTLKEHLPRQECPQGKVGLQLWPLNRYLIVVCTREPEGKRGRGLKVLLPREKDLG
ncbi:MAG: hypothetical protein AAFV46_14790, partial [Cyanobacteria bacterium J06635_11]